MNLSRLIFRSLSFYWKSHLAVVIGVAICAMVITGTLIVGDSIRSSLEQTALLRLGKTEYVFSGIDRYFRASLADSIGDKAKIDAAPILQMNGFASSQGGIFKLNNVQVIGIDGKFRAFLPGGSLPDPPGKNDVFISENLAQRLQLAVDDPLLLRIEKASQLPKNAPFVSDDESQVSIRLSVKKVLSTEELGRFNLKNSQTAPFNVFVSLSFLNEQMELDDKANKLLFTGNNTVKQNDIDGVIQKYWTIEDMALAISPVMDGANLEIRSERVFIDSSVTETVKAVVPEADEILTYMVNSFRKGDRETPYSFLAAGPFHAPDPEVNDKIVVNSWMANDLDAQIGDSIEISYFVIGALRQLREESKWLTVAEIVDMKGIYGDRSLMPDLPGMSDAGNCRDWEAGVPIALDKIRDKDEDYWNKYRGTPKAFIGYDLGRELWENRFGVCTAIRVPADVISTEDLEVKLATALPPQSQGFALRSVKEEGLTAARGGVDFGQLFMGLSFFLLVAGMILMALLFNMHLEKRLGEIGTLKALGYPSRTIKMILLYEGLLIAIPGVLAGGALAVVYNKIIFYALNTVWYDIVRTSILREVILAKTMIMGTFIALVLASVSIWFNVNRRLKAESASLQRRLNAGMKKRGIFWLKAGSGLAAIGAVSLLAYEMAFGQTLNTGIFFVAGGLLLLAFILSFSAQIRKGALTSARELSQTSLILKNLTRNPSRSFRIVTLFALGTFIIISTGLNKKDLHQGANLPTSGTGGFQFYMETTIPVLKNMNDTHVRTDQGIEKPMHFVQMRKSEGDDASCLNLNRVVSPRILGIPTDELKGRFTFIKSTEDLSVDDPWTSLKEELPGGVVPAVLDQTVIQWGLGKKVGDTLVYLNETGQEMKLKIIGGLANSIFQGNVLIDDQLFLKHYPSNSGSHVFLVDADENGSQETRDELARAFRNEGVEIDVAAERLAMFNQIENTYLSIFMLLGGLAMILGTVGLGISLARNIMDRSREIGILRAIGYHKSKILNIITYEHLILLLTGTLSGAVTAFVATLPSILSEFVQASWQTATIIVALILLNGMLWIFGITWNSLKKDVISSLRSE
jgi:ABC-type lipoprotein release transport system permease subunit